MEHDTAGDPVSGVKWTRRTTEKIAAELGTAGIVVCPNTVAKLLKGLGYRLRANAKKLNRKRTRRDAQFVYIAAMRESFAQAGLPVVSVDSKHRELVGDFKNPGATWEEEPILVNDHDFPSSQGVALPYGSTTSLPTTPVSRSARPTTPRTSQSTTWPGGGLPRAAATTRRHRTARARRLRWQQRGTHPGWKYGLSTACATGTASRSPFATTERRLEVEPH